MVTLNNINTTIALWIIGISCLSIIFLINYIFLKLGIPNKGITHYGVINKVISPRELKVEVKTKFMFRTKIKTITVRYMQDVTSEDSLKKLNKELVGKTIKFSKIHNILDVLHKKSIKSLLQYCIYGGTTYSVEILDEDITKLKYIPKCITPTKDYVKHVIDNNNGKIKIDDIIGYFDRKLYRKFLSTT